MNSKKFLISSAASECNWMPVSLHYIYRKHIAFNFNRKEGVDKNAHFTLYVAVLNPPVISSEC